MGTSIEDILRLSQQLTQPDQTAPQQMQVARPSTVVGLLGNALGGGSTGNVPLTQEQADAEGRGALLNFGLNLLENSGYSTRRRSLGQLVAGGIRGAQGSIGDYESQLAARQAALQAQQQQSLENRFRGIDAATKVAELQQRLKQLQQIGAIPTSGPGNGTSVAGGDDIYSLPKEQFLAAVAKRESGGNPTAKNYVWESDPTAYERGATASGKYQMVNSTWLAAAKAAGVDTSKYPTARDAPEAVQDQVASKLYDMEGTSPWNPAKFGQRWVKDEKTGKYTLEKGGGDGTGGGGGGPPAPPTKPPAETKSATTALPTPPEPPEGMLPSPIRPETTAPANVGRGPGGAVVAGPPGAATVGAARPAGPEAQSDAEAIARGMIQAGADPTTLAAGAPSRGPGTLAAGPGGGETTPRAAAIAQAQATNTPTQVEGVPGLWALPNGQVVNRTPSVGLPGSISPGPVPPAQQPPPEVKPPATPPAPPAEAQPYRVDTTKPFTFDPKQNPPPQWMLDQANPTPTKAESSEAATIEKGYTAARAAAAASGDAGKIADVERDFASRRHDLQTRIDARVKEGNTALRQQQQDAFNQQRDIYKENVNAEQTRLTNREQVDNKAREGVYDKINTESLAINDRIASLNNLRAMSDQLGPGTPLSDQQVDFFAKLGLGSPDFIKRMGTVQAFRAAANLAVKDVRAGMAMGGMSDRDLTFIENMIPNAHQDPYTRELVINMIVRGQERKQQALSDIQTRMAGGMAPAQAIQEARKAMPPLFTQAPKEVDKMTPDERANWFRDNLQPRTLYRRGNGAVDIYWGPDGPSPGYSGRLP